MGHGFMNWVGWYSRRWRLIAYDRLSRHQGKTVEQTLGNYILPDGFILLGDAGYDYARMSLMLVVSHLSFPVVRHGDHIEEAPRKWR